MLCMSSMPIKAAVCMHNNHLRISCQLDLLAKGDSRTMNGSGMSSYRTPLEHLAYLVAQASAKFLSIRSPFQSSATSESSMCVRHEYVDLRTMNGLDVKHEYPAREGKFWNKEWTRVAPLAYMIIKATVEFLSIKSLLGGSLCIRCQACVPGRNRWILEP